MAKHNPENERIKRKYFAYLKEAKRHSEPTVDAAAKALSRFEEYNQCRDFKAFHYQQAVAFKRHLAEQKGQRSGEKLSKATLYAALKQLKAFFFWLAGQPGYKARLQYSDADYFNLSEKDTRIATAHRAQKSPTLEQVKHVLQKMPFSTEIERRNRALVAFILLTGARDSAVASMKLKHVDLLQGCVHQDARDVDGLPTPWPSDRVQIAAQALILRNNGYSCDEGILYYATTKQRVRITIDDALIAETEELIAQARKAAVSDQIPEPLVDSPKCPRCSLVGICLPDETNALRARALRFEERRPVQFSLFETIEEAVTTEVRQLVAARDDLRPLYLSSQGFRVGKSGEVIQIKDGDSLKQEVRLGEVSQINLFGNVQLSTQAIQSFCSAEVPVCYFSQGGWFYGITNGLNAKNVFLRHRQFVAAGHEATALNIAQKLVVGKIEARTAGTNCMRGSPFRDEFIAASLKRNSRSLFMYRLTSFRDEFIAASLKLG